MNFYVGCLRVLFVALLFALSYSAGVTLLFGDNIMVVFGPKLQVIPICIVTLKC